MIDFSREGIEANPQVLIDRFKGLLSKPYSNLLGKEYDDLKHSNFFYTAEHFDLPDLFNIINNIKAANIGDYSGQELNQLSRIYTFFLVADRLKNNNFEKYYYLNNLVRFLFNLEMINFHQAQVIKRTTDPLLNQDGHYITSQTFIAKCSEINGAILCNKLENDVNVIINDGNVPIQARVGIVEALILSDRELPENIGDIIGDLGAAGADMSELVKLQNERGSIDLMKSFTLELDVADEEEFCKLVKQVGEYRPSKYGVNRFSNEFVLEYNEIYNDIFQKIIHGLNNQMFRNIDLVREAVGVLKQELLNQEARGIVPEKFLDQVNEIETRLNTLGGGANNPVINNNRNSNPPQIVPVNNQNNVQGNNPQAIAIVVSNNEQNNPEPEEQPKIKRRRAKGNTQNPPVVDPLANNPIVINNNGAPHIDNNNQVVINNANPNNQPIDVSQSQMPDNDDSLSRDSRVGSVSDDNSNHSQSMDDLSQSIGDDTGEQSNQQENENQKVNNACVAGGVTPLALCLVVGITYLSFYHLNKENKLATTSLQNFYELIKKPAVIASVAIGVLLISALVTLLAYVLTEPRGIGSNN